MSREHLRRESFNEVAELYARARPAYPRALVDELVALTGLGSESRVLEIGCGPGLFTLPLAQTGASILALELGDQLARVARQQLSAFPAVEVVLADFDVWTPPQARFDLVLIATAFHWLDRVTRLQKCAAALRPGGALAIIETHWGVGPTRDRFSSEMGACFERWDREHAPYYVPQTLDALPQHHPDLERAAQFEPAVLRRYCVERNYSTAQYRDLMDTWSALRALQPADRAGLLACIGALIDARYGGMLQRHDAYSLWLARRAS